MDYNARGSTSRFKLRSLSGILLLTTLIISSSAYADRAVKGDYNGDGLSDILVTRDIGDFKFWFARFSDTTTNTPALFGLATDEELAADYDGDGDFQPGVTRTDALGFKQWYSLSQAATVVQRQWGLDGDILTTGNFDTDDKADLVAIRKQLGNLTWYINKSTGESEVFNWGLPEKVLSTTSESDEPFIGEFDGDGIDDAVVARKLNGFWLWYVRGSTAGGRDGVLFGLDSDTLLEPSDIDGNGIADFIVRREINGFSYLFIRLNDLNGASIGEQSFQFGLTKDVIQMANFFSPTKASASAFRPSGSTILGSNHYVKLPGEGTNALIVPFGLGGDSLVGPRGKEMTNSEDGANPTPAVGLGQVCSSIASPYRGFLWKPSSDHSGFPREGRPLVAWQTNSPNSDSCLDVFAADGSVVTQLGIYVAGGRYGARWYSGWGCGSRLSGSEIARKAESQSGSSKVYVEARGGTCVGPINPSARNGSLN